MNREQFVAACKAQYTPHLARIDQGAVAGLAVQAASAQLASESRPWAESPPFGSDGAPSAKAVKAARYLLAQTALQYRFWDIDSATGAFVRYELAGSVGSTGLVKAFDLAWGPTDDPLPALLAASESVEGVVAAFGPIPGAVSRRDILAQVLSAEGLLVCDHVLRRISKERKVSVELASEVAQRLPRAYGDPFLKKAMLFLGLLASYLRRFVAVEDGLCAYADYQVPNVLRHHGVLVYGESLARAVDSQQVLASGGQEETAIRAATILACEQIASHFAVTAAEVDWWCFMQRKKPTKPFHLTMTTHY